MGRLRFGPAGKPTNFKGDYDEVPPLLRQMGLDALEYEAVRGVRVTPEKAQAKRGTEHYIDPAKVITSLRPLGL